MSSGDYEKLQHDTLWPTIRKAEEVEWVLRYGKTFNKELSREEELFLASVCSAYIHLRNNPNSDWRQKVNARNGLLKCILDWMDGKGGIHLQNEIKKMINDGDLQGETSSKS